MADILGVKAGTLNPPWEQKRCYIGLSWVFLRDFIYNHLNEENGLGAFALAIYGLIIFPQVLGHIEVSVIDFFSQFQHGCNPAIAILAETIRSLNYCRQNKETRFTRYAPLLYMWIRSHVPCEGIVFKKPYFPRTSPINEFCQNRWPESKTEEWWFWFFQGLKSKQLKWMAP